MRTPWLSNIYHKSPNVSVLKKKVDGIPFYILLNPDIGSWVVLSEEEYDRYEKEELTETEYETLYVRGLSLD